MSPTAGRLAWLWLAWLAPGALSQVKLFLDTDMSTDVDDVVALCIAHKLQDLGEVELVGIVHDTGLEEGVGAISAINHYHGRDHIPLGAYKGDFGNPRTDPDPWVKQFAAGPYVHQLVRDFAGPVRNSSEVPDAVHVYRSVLARQPERSVVIASIGFLGNLAALLASRPDRVSELTGEQLVARTVKELVVMGGGYPDSSSLHYEWNFGGGCKWGSAKCPYTPEWTKAVVDGWPASVPMTFSGFEVGDGVLSGGTVSSCASPRSPCRRALEMYHKADPKCPPRPSWDPVTTLYAARGLQRWAERQQGGHNVINSSDGSNRWLDGPPGHQSYLALIPGKGTGVGKDIDDLLCDAKLFA